MQGWKLVEILEAARKAPTSIDSDHLAVAYNELVAGAPKRQHGYLVAHEGVPSTKGATNRIEEHLAIALFNASRDGRRIALPDGGSLRFLDYQVSA